MNPQEVRQYLYVQIEALCQKRPWQLPSEPLSGQSKQNQMFSLLVVCYNSLLNIPLNQACYLQNKKFVISTKVRQIGQIASILGRFIFQGKHQFHDLASFQITNFVKKSQPKLSKLINIMQGIFPLTNVHKDNLPLYVPFREFLDNYQKIGNSNWQLSRHMLQVYQQSTRESKAGSGQDQEVHLQQVLLITSAIDMLLGHKILFDQAQENKGIVEIIWSFTYINYIRQTLKPYSKSNRDEIKFYSQSPKLGQQSKKLQNIQERVQQLHEMINNYSIQQQNNNHPQTNVLANLAMFILTKQHKQHKQHKYFFKCLNQFFTVFQLNMSYKRFQLMPICNALIYSILNLIKQRGGNEQNIKEQLDEIILISHKYKEDFIKDRINYWGECLPVFYNYHRRQNQDQNGDFNEIQNELIQTFKYVINEDLNNIFPFYPYFNKRMNQEVSKYYIQKVPAMITEVVRYLPDGFIIQNIFKQKQILLNCKSCNKVIDYLSDRKNKDKITKQIQEKFKIQQAQFDYDYFIKCWNSYHSLVNSAQFKSQNLGIDKQKIILKEIYDFLSLSNQQILPTFRKVVYLPFDNQDILYSIIKNYFEGISWLQSQGEKTDSYLKFIESQNFRTVIMQKLNSQQMDQLWKICGYILLNRKSIFNQLLLKQNEESASKVRQQGENIGSKDKNEYRMILQD